MNWAYSKPFQTVKRCCWRKKFKVSSLKIYSHRQWNMKWQVLFFLIQASSRARSWFKASATPSPWTSPYRSRSRCWSPHVASATAIPASSTAQYRIICFTSRRRCTSSMTSCRSSTPGCGCFGCCRKLGSPCTSGRRNASVLRPRRSSSWCLCTTLFWSTSRWDSTGDGTISQKSKSKWVFLISHDLKEKTMYAIAIV